MKQLIVIICLLISFSGYAQMQKRDSITVPAAMYLNKAQSQAYIGGALFILGGAAWTLNQYDYFTDERTVFRAYNAGSMLMITTGLMFEVFAIENIIDAQRAKYNLSLRASPSGVTLALKF